MRVLIVTMSLFVFVFFMSLYQGTALSDDSSVEVEENYENWSDSDFETDESYEDMNNSSVDIEKKFITLRERLLQNESALSYIYSTILGYAAIREDDKFLCNSDQICERTFDSLIIFRKFAEKKCGDISSDVSQNVVTLCENLDDCTAIEDKGLRDVCMGFNSGDVALIRVGLKSVDERQKATDHASEESITEWISMYHGFKPRNGQQDCEVYASELNGKRSYLCDVIFSSLSLKDILDEVVSDLAYFLLSTEIQDAVFCEYITNDAVRNGCLSLDPVNYFEDSPSMGGSDEFNVIAML